jgi:DNA-directed RNA polymerase specialized sigma24 family protein
LLVATGYWMLVTHFGGFAGAPPYVDIMQALVQLAQLDPRKARIIELRFFGGMSVDETAEFLGISPATALREWQKAKAWLYRELSADKEDAS